LYVSQGGNPIGHTANNRTKRRILQYVENPSKIMAMSFKIGME
jgi:hypothetical protein